MKVLLDTHAFLWGITDAKPLSSDARKVLTSAELWLSVASLWESLIKVQIGKLSLPRPAGAFLAGELASNGVHVLPVSLVHVLRIEALPLHHRDPFDRMLIAQSLEEGWPIVTADPIFKRYPVRVIW
jgi:PIN domain nuclease of toxin-antitoxin system